MKNSALFSLIITVALLMHISALAQLPTLGVYPNSSVIASQSITVTPNVPPSNTLAATAYSSGAFSGIINVNPTSGVVTITNAKHAGTFVITLTAIGILGNTATATFSLTVTNTLCSQGNFDFYSSVPVYSSSVGLTVGDFNGDGNEDIASLNSALGLASIRLGDGNGNLSGSTDVSVGTTPTKIAIGDFNGDGNQDLAVANTVGAGTISIRLGDGLGGFSGSTNIVVGNKPKGLAVGDFNGDGKQDIAVTNNGSNTVSICLGNGSGNFSVTATLAVGTLPLGIVSGDFNGDGKLDLAIANKSANYFSIRLGNGLGGFSIGTNVIGGNSHIALALVDYNGDGKLDFVSPNAGGGYSIAIGNGLGGFACTNYNPLYQTGPDDVNIGDFNGDGKQDFALSNNYVVCMLGDGVNYYIGSTTITNNGYNLSLAVGDFNNDGRQDIVTTNATNSASVFLGGAGEIDLSGNAVSIPDGTISTSLVDHTDFGTAILGNSVTRTFTIKNTGKANLAIGSISKNGGDSTLFTLGSLTPPSPIIAGGMATFTVNFTPVIAGLKQTTIHVATNTCTIKDYDFAIQAFGKPSIGNYPNNTIIVGRDTTIIPSAAPIGAVYSTAYTNSNFTGTIAVNPVTGLLSITNAKHVGTYTVTVKNFGIAGTSATTTFTLIVTTPNVSVPFCDKVLFRNAPNVSVGNAPNAIAVGDFNQDQKQDFITANHASNTVSVRLGNGSGGFTGTTEIAVGANPSSIAIADFNGDGKQDFATADKDSNTVAIRFGNGLGGFNGTTNVAVGVMPTSIAVGDFNGDGRKDFATTNFGADNVSILLGDGLGGFTGSSSIAAAANPIFIAVGDFNNDGNHDFITANYTANNVSICLGDGTGGFGAATNFVTGTNPQAIAIGDFNADGNQDFAVANYGSNNVSVFIGNGTGSFTNTTTLAVGTGPCAIAVSDFNNDGYQDFAVVNNTSSTITICNGDGSGGFSFSRDKVLAAGSASSAIAVGDFNKDSFQDFVVANTNLSNVAVCLAGRNEIDLFAKTVNLTDGSTSTLVSNQTDFGYLLIGNPTPAYTYTIKNKGLADLSIDSVYASGGNSDEFIVSLLSPPSPIAAGDSATFTVSFVPTTFGFKTSTIHIANNDCEEADYDFALKGAAIVPATIGQYSNITVCSGKNITINPNVAPAYTAFATAYTSTKFTGVLVVNPTTGAVTITNARDTGTFIVTVTAFSIGGLYNATTTFILSVTNPLCSQANFRDTINVSVGSSPIGLAIGDFNGDNKQDLAVANYNGNTVSIRLGDGNGNFSGITEVPVGINPVSISVGDFNGDGLQDFGTANNISNNVSICLGNGTGGFTAAANVPVANHPKSFAIGDFNSDGKQDLAIAVVGNNVSIRLGDGSGSFTGTTNVYLGSGFPNQIAIGDFNNDGNQDFAVTNGSVLNLVSIRLGNGLGNFSGNINIPVADWPTSIIISDFNGDGNQDFATKNIMSDTISIRLGNGLGGFPTDDDLILKKFANSLTAADFNGDGNQDIAAYITWESNLFIRLGNGLGSKIIEVPNVPYNTALAVGDFNGDSIFDIATIGNGQNQAIISLGGTNKINVLGDTSNITDGANVPSLVNQTAFGNVYLDSNQVHTLTIKNNGTTSLAISSITISGSDSAMFTVDTLSSPSPIAAGDSVTFTIAFKPVSMGLKTTTVHITNDNCDNGDYDFVIQGNGIALCTDATMPTLSASSYSNCGSQATILSIASGTLNDATDWKWYRDSCGGILEATGSSVIVVPTVTTTYYARGEGGCTTPGSCANLAITVNSNPLVPTIAGSLIICAGSSTNLTATVSDSYIWSTGATTQTININTAGTYTVTVTNVNGCSSSTAAVVTVNAKPIPIVAGNSAFCIGGSTTLNAGSGFSSYLWSTGATTQSINANTAATFMVTVTNASGCTASASITTSISAKPSPAITGNLTPCSGSSTILTTGSYIGYLWSTGETTQAITVAATANYKVTVSNATGCTGSTSVKVIKQNSPSVIVTPSASIICPPDISAVLVASGTASTFVWSPAIGLSQTAGASVTASPASTTTYTVTGTSLAGCTATLTTRVTVNPKPSILTTTNIMATVATANWDVVSCAVGYSLQYRVTGGVWIKLNINTNTTSKVIAGLTPSTNYQWRVRAKYPDGTYSSYSSIVSFATPALREGEQIKSAVCTIYPNPATDKLIVEFPFSSDEANIQVINAVGQTVLKYNANDTDSTIELNIAHLPTGLYLIEVINGSNRFTSNFIKE